MAIPRPSLMTTPTGHMMALQRHLVEYLRQTRLEVFILIRYGTIFASSAAVAKLSGSLKGWMTCSFTALSMVFQSLLRRWEGDNERL